MIYRHEWQREPRYRWRVVERCVHCGTRKWLVAFPNSTGNPRQAPLFARKDHDPWSISQPDCKAKRKRGPK